MGRYKFSLLGENQRPLQAVRFKHPEIEQALQLSRYFQSEPAKMLDLEELKNSGAIENYKKLGMANIENFIKEYNKVFEEVGLFVARYMIAGEIYTREVPKAAEPKTEKPKVTKKK